MASKQGTEDFNRFNHTNSKLVPAEIVNKKVDLWSDLGLGDSDDEVTAANDIGSQYSQQVGQYSSYGPPQPSTHGSSTPPAVPGHDLQNVHPSGTSGAAPNRNYQSGGFTAINRPAPPPLGPTSHPTDSIDDDFEDDDADIQPPDSLRSRMSRFDYDEDEDYEDGDTESDADQEQSDHDDAEQDGGDDDMQDQLTGQLDRLNVESGENEAASEDEGASSAPGDSASPLAQAISNDDMSKPATMGDIAAIRQQTSLILALLQQRDQQRDHTFEDCDSVVALRQELVQTSIDMQELSRAVPRFVDNAQKTTERRIEILQSEMREGMSKLEKTVKEVTGEAQKTTESRIDKMEETLQAVVQQTAQIPQEAADGLAVNDTATSQQLSDVAKAIDKINKDLSKVQNTQAAMSKQLAALGMAINVPDNPQPLKTMSEEIKDLNTSLERCEQKTMELTKDVAKFNITLKLAVEDTAQKGVDLVTQEVKLMINEVGSQAGRSVDRKVKRSMRRLEQKVGDVVKKATAAVDECSLVVFDVRAKADGLKLYEGHLGDLRFDYMTSGREMNSSMIHFNNVVKQHTTDIRHILAFSMPSIQRILTGAAHDVAHNAVTLAINNVDQRDAARSEQRDLQISSLIASSTTQAVDTTVEQMQVDLFAPAQGITSAEAQDIVSTTIQRSNAEQLNLIQNMFKQYQTAEKPEDQADKTTKRDLSNALFVFQFYQDETPWDVKGLWCLAKHCGTLNKLLTELKNKTSSELVDHGFDAAGLDVMSIAVEESVIPNVPLLRLSDRNPQIAADMYNSWYTRNVVNGWKSGLNIEINFKKAAQKAIDAS